MAKKQFFSLAALQYNLRRLLLLRTIILLFLLLALFYVYFILDLTLNYFSIAISLLIIVFINLGLAFRLRKNRMVNEFEFLFHLLLDIVGLSIFLFFSGGASNPFVSYFLVPITISAAILPWSYTWIVAGVSLLSYSFLLFFYQPLPELMPMEMETGADGNATNLHIIGMWLNFLMSAALITYFVVKMAKEIRTQQEKLSLYKEDSLRDEQILAVATQAAGTAHELGTPLSTATILLNDMLEEYSDKPQLQEEVSLLLKQITLCKGSLKKLVKQADFRHGDAARIVSLRDFIMEILDQWQLLRPEVDLQFDMPVEGDMPLISVESTLQQAIVNMLNNAADASSQGLEVELKWDELHWYIRIRDFGDGIDIEIAEQLGNSMVSTKVDGLGVGIILSHASISRLGGELSFYSHEDKGTITQIRLPIITNLAGK